MRMSEEAWDTVLDTNLKGAFSHLQGFRSHFHETETRTYHQHILRHWAHGERWTNKLRGQQGRAHRSDKIHCKGTRSQKCNLQCHRTGVYRHRYDRRIKGGSKRGNP